MMQNIISTVINTALQIKDFFHKVYIASIKYAYSASIYFFP